MEQQFCRILQGVIEYEKKSLGIVCVLFFIALIVIIVAVAMSFKKAKQIDRIIICCILFVFCGAFIGTLITNHHYRAALQADMDTCAFITYSGQMVHDDYQKDSFYHRVTIYPDGTSSIRLDYPDYGNQYHLYDDSERIPVGAVSGTVVYAKNSKVIVYWQSEQRSYTLHSRQIIV